MYVVVAYDVSKEKVRGRLRRLLRRLGLSMVNWSVYAGPGGEVLARRVAEEASRIIEEGDNVFVIVVTQREYERAYVVASGSFTRVSERGFEVL